MLQGILCHLFVHFRHSSKSKYTGSHSCSVATSIRSLQCMSRIKFFCIRNKLAKCAQTTFVNGNSLIKVRQLKMRCSVSNQQLLFLTKNVKLLIIMHGIVLHCIIAVLLTNPFLAIGIYSVSMMGVSDNLTCLSKEVLHTLKVY